MIDRQKHQHLVKTAEEQDCFTKWGKRYLCMCQRPGVRKAAKSRYNRRLRRQERQHLNAQRNTI